MVEARAAMIVPITVIHFYPALRRNSTDPLFSLRLCKSTLGTAGRRIPCERRNAQYS
jgi:hypothetical protein